MKNLCLSLTALLLASCDFDVPNLNAPAIETLQNPTPSQVNALATGLLEIGLELAQEQADRWAEAECLSGLGHIALLTGDPRRARILAEQARDAIRECGDKVAEADVLNLLAVARTRLGQFGPSGRYEDHRTQ